MFTAFYFFIHSVSGHVFFEHFTLCVWNSKQGRCSWETLLLVAFGPSTHRLPRAILEVAYSCITLISSSRILAGGSQSARYYMSSISFNSHNYLCKVGNHFNHQCILLLEKLRLYGVEQITQSQAISKQWR